MGTNLQIRSVDESLAAAVKAEAARRRLSLSDYLKTIIERDLESSSAARARRRMYDTVSASPLRGLATRAQIADSLAAARRDSGTE